MSFFSFCKSLLFDPVAFTDTYFKEGRARPEFKAHLHKVLYTVPLVQILVRVVLNSVKELFFVDFQEKISIGELIGFLGGNLIGIAINLGLTYLALPYLYRLNCWIFQKTVYWAGGRMTREQGVDIALYLGAFGTLVLCLMTPVNVFIVPAIIFLEMDVWLRVVFLIYLCIASLIFFYIEYCIIKKLISVRVWLVLLLRYIILPFIVLFATFLFVLGIIGVFYFVNYLIDL